MARKLCDLCGKIKEIRKFPRNELRKEQSKILKTLGIKKEKIVKIWIHPKFEKLEQTNKGFRRKSRLCKDCQKSVGLNE